MCRCDSTRVEKISQLITEIVTGDMLVLSFVEGGGFPQADDVCWAGVQASITVNNNFESGVEDILWGKRGEI